MGFSAKTSSLGGDGELGPVAEINVTPLVDVMLVLLIIFMVTAPVMMNQLPIALPRPSPSQSDKPPDKFVIDFDLQNQYFIQQNDEPKQPVDYAALPAQLREIAQQRPNLLITVCADKDAVYDRVVDLMSVVGDAGFEKVTLCP
jgi:biopolymer transport protein ExbD